MPPAAAAEIPLEIRSSRSACRGNTSAPPRAPYESAYGERPQCRGALLRPDSYEIDTTTISQVTISPSYSVTTTRAFDAEGVTVCSLSEETSYTYDVLMGTLTSTTTTDTATTLNAINY